MALVKNDGKPAEWMRELSKVSLVELFNQYSKTAEEHARASTTCMKGADYIGARVHNAIAKGYTEACQHINEFINETYGRN